MDAGDRPKPLLIGRPYWPVDEFCRSSRLDRSTVQALVVAGRLEGALDPDGKVTYVFGEDFPSATALRAWGFVVSDHYDPRQLSSHEAHFGESEDMEPYERAHPDWTMSPDDLPD